MSRKFEFISNFAKITVTLHEDQNTFLIISRSILHRMRNVSDKSCRGNQNTHVRLNNFSFFSKIRAVYEIIWKSVVEPGRPKMTIWRMLFALWIPKATDTH